MQKKGSQESLSWGGFKYEKLPQVRRGAQPRHEIGLAWLGVEQKGGAQVFDTSIYNTQL